MIYLASPMSHPNPAIVEARYHIAAIHAAYLKAQGIFVYSPGVYALGLATVGMEEIKWTHEQWMSYDREIFDTCKSLIVLKIPGWEESKGVQIEIGWAKSEGKLCTYSHPCWESYSLLKSHNKMLFEEGEYSC